MLRKKSDSINRMLQTIRGTRRRSRRKLLVESLEKRLVMATWNYSFEWSIYEDQLGDGLTADDTPAPGDFTVGIGDRVRTDRFLVGDTRSQQEWKTFKHPLPNTLMSHGGELSARGSITDNADVGSMRFRYGVSSPEGWKETTGAKFGPGWDVGAWDDPRIIILPLVDRDTGQLLSGTSKSISAFFKTPKVSGTVYSDKNFNSIHDGDEQKGFSNIWVFQDINNNGAYDQDEPTTTTDEYGRYELKLNPDADGSPIRIIDDHGAFKARYVWTNTPQLVTVRSGQDHTGVDFGLYEKTTVEGHVFQDLNGNQRRESNEPPYEGVLVFIDRNGDGQVDSSQCFDDLPQEPCFPTRADGSFKIQQAIFGDVVTVRSPGIPPALFTITQRNQWVAGEHNLQDVNFGIFQNVQFGGQVFKDVNGDGARDHYVDSFLGGVDVLMDLKDDGTIDLVSRTDARGVYTFFHIPPGSHRITPSFANPSNQTLPKVGFGYLLEVNASGNSNYDLPFGVRVGTPFKDGKIDPPDPKDPPPPDPYATEKLAMMRRINSRMAELQTRPMQRKINEQVSKLLEFDTYGVPLASLGSLDSILRMLHSEVIKNEQEGIREYDVYDLLAKDADRIKTIWNKGIEGIANSIVQPAATWNWLWDGVYGTSTMIGQATDALVKWVGQVASELTDMSKEAVIYGTFETVEDLLTPATWSNLLADASGYNQFVKSMDPTLNVDDRILHYFGGVLTYMGTVDFGVTSASTVKARAMQLGDNLMREAVEGLDGPAGNAIRKYFNGQIKGKIERKIAGAKNWIYELAEGVPIDANFIHEVGYSAKQMDAITQVTREVSKDLGKDVYFGFRTTNMDSMRHIRDGTALPKPLAIKAKTINEMDVKYLGFSAEDVGLVGLKHPSSLKAPRPTDFDSEALFKKVEERYSKRIKEYAAHEQDILNGSIKHDTTRGLITDSTSAKPFAGDIDPVYIKDSNGFYLTGEDYDKAVAALKRSAGQIQHGAETNIISDVMKKVEQSGIAPNSEAWNKALKKVKEVQLDLKFGHTGAMDGKIPIPRTETIIEFGRAGSIAEDLTIPASSSEYMRRGPNLETLHIVDDAPVIGTVPKQRQEMERLLNNLGVSADEFARMSRDQRAQLLRVRAQDRRVLMDDRVSRVIREKGITSELFREMPASEVKSLSRSHHDGLKIVSQKAQPIFKSEVEATLTSAGISLSEVRILPIGDNEGWDVVRRDSFGPTELDVDRNSNISPLDVLQVVNALNGSRAGLLHEMDSIENYRLDTNGNGYIEPLDALVIINRINLGGVEIDGGEGEGDGPSHSQVNRSNEMVFAAFASNEEMLFGDDVHVRRNKRRFGQ